MYSFPDLEPVCCSMSSSVSSWPAYKFLRRQVRWAKTQREAKSIHTNSSFHKPIHIIYALPYSFFPIHDFLQLTMNMEEFYWLGDIPWIMWIIGVFHEDVKELPSPLLPPASDCPSKILCRSCISIISSKTHINSQVEFWFINPHYRYN